MKWSSILVLGAIAFLTNACEKHEVAELPPEHATAFGEHAWSPKGRTTQAEARRDAPVKPSEGAPVATPAPVVEGAGFFPKNK